MNKKIIGGVFLAFFNYTLVKGNTRIDILPDFIGFFLIYIGIKEVLRDIGENEVYRKAEKLSFAMTLYATVVYAVSVAGFYMQFPLLGTGLGIVYLVGAFYTLYLMTKGVMSLESDSNLFLDAEKLYSTWRYLLIFNVVAAACSFVASLAVAVLVCMGAGFIVLIMFLTRLNFARKVYAANYN